MASLKCKFDQIAFLLKQLHSVELEYLKKKKSPISYHAGFTQGMLTLFRFHDCASLSTCKDFICVVLSDCHAHFFSLFPLLTPIYS